MNSIEIKDLSLNFGNVKVLKDLNLSVEKGEFLVLLGASGCGKSTLLNCIAGLLEINDGQIFINNQNVTWYEPSERGIGMVFQSYALYPQMSVKGNLTFSLKNAKLSKEDIEERVKNASEILQIEDLLDRKPAALSGGQRQRVAIGRALVRDVEVFLFDEPLSNLDAKLRVEMRTEIKKLHQRIGTTIVYVTHDQIEAMTLADRIAVLKDGELQQVGTPYEIYNDPVSHFVADFMGSPGMNFIECIVKDENLIIESGGQKYELSIPCKDAIKNSKLDVVLLGIRPEMLTEIEPSVEKNSFIHQIKFDVDVLEPMGADTVAIGKWNDNEVMARLSPEAGNTAGKGFDLQVDTSKAILFDPNSGLRIR